MTRICDYEGSRYRFDFWESGARQYEDMVERIAIRKMLPPFGTRLIEVGAGFGRLADLYNGYEQVVLVDYARTQLEEAQQFLGEQADKYILVVADVYGLPFNAGAFDALVMVRVMHHLVNVPSALKELRRIVQGKGTAIIEFASKRHLKAILRWLLRRQKWSPFSPQPEEFVALNIDFHPKWMRQQFSSAGFSVDEVRTVSHFRIPLLKKLFPAKLLATLDGWAQPTGKWWQLTPSVFLKASVSKDATLSAELFRCPSCGCNSLHHHELGLLCPQCQKLWELRGGIYDFKNPLKTN